MLNLELTVAVTHNYASEFGPSFQRMCDEVVQDEPQFSLQWCEGLRNNGRQDLATSTQQNEQERLANAKGVW